MAGGLSAVIWTDFVQTIIMVIGAFILSGFGELVIFVGKGWGEVEFPTAFYNDSNVLPFTMTQMNHKMA